MKIYKAISNFYLVVMLIFHLIFSSFVLAASYDISNNVSPNNISLPFENFPMGWEMIDDEFFAVEKNRKEKYLLIFSLLRQAQLEDAQNIIAEQLKLFPDDPGFHNLLALQKVLKKDTGQAQQSYLKVINLDPDNVVALLGLAELELENGSLNKAKNYVDKVLKNNDKSINAYLLLADIANKQNNQQQVEKVLLTAYKKSQGNVKQEIKVATSLGKLFSKQKQPDKILSIAKEISGRYPVNSQVLSFLAGAQLVNNKKQLAGQTLRKIIQREKQDINHRFLLSNILSEHPGNENEVAKLLDEISSIAPDNPKVLAQKTNFLIKIGRYRQAILVAKKIESLAPKAAISNLLKGDIYLAQKRLDLALLAYQEAYQKMSNKNSVIYTKLATVYQQQSNNEKAIKYYNEVLKEQPDNSSVLNELAWLYSLQNNNKAINFAKKAYAISPDSAAIADTYGYILVKQKQLKKGLAILEKAVNLDPKIYDIHFHLAEGYSLNNNQKKAIEVLERIVNTGKDFPEKEAAILLLNNLKSKF